MQGKQKIIDDILQSASASAAAMVKEATEQCEAELKELRAALDAAQAEELKKIEADAHAVYSGQIKLGELEAGKVMLKARQECAAAVYDGVKTKLKSAPDKEYLDLYAKLVASVCEDGDEVIVAKSDAKRMTAAWVKKVGTSAKKKLTLSKTQGDFDGGVILRNAKYDRDFSVDEVVNELKERTLSDTVRKLGL